MAAFSKELSPLPIVDLDDIGSPSSGILLDTNRSCQRYFAAGDRCAEHYRALLQTSAGSLRQCPHGFASMRIEHESFNIALTGFIPFPRLGGNGERSAAKRHPETKMPVEAVQKAGVALTTAADRFMRAQSDIAKGFAMALHEVRKLNRTVKQTAERACIAASPENPEAADGDLVNIWKAADLMSQQFDIVEFLANEEMAKLPRKTISEVYRVFHKFVHIYQRANQERRITISALYGYSPRVLVSDKTFPIIASVLIENALKYSIRATDISIVVARRNGFCEISVASLSRGDQVLDAKVFHRGVRLDHRTDGSGIGLYVARKIAEQHEGTIMIRSELVAPNVMRHTFVVQLPEYVG